MNPEVHHDNNGSGFVEGFVNQDMLADPTVIPHYDVLQSNIGERFGVNPVSLQGFLVASYYDKVHESVASDLHLQSLNESQTDYICQVLLLSDLFDDYSTLRHLMCALNGPAETVRTQTILTLISGT